MNSTWINIAIIFVVLLVFLYYLHQRYNIFDYEPFKWALGKIKEFAKKS